MKTPPAGSVQASDLAREARNKTEKPAKPTTVKPQNAKGKTSKKTK